MSAQITFMNEHSLSSLIAWLLFYSIVRIYKKKKPKIKYYFRPHLVMKQVIFKF